MDDIQKKLLSYLKKHDKVEEGLQKRSPVPSSGSTGVDEYMRERSGLSQRTPTFSETGPSTSTTGSSVPSQDKKPVAPEKPPRIRPQNGRRKKAEAQPSSASQGWSSDESVLDAIRETVPSSSTASPSGRGFKGDAGGIEQPSKPQIHHFIRSWERQQLMKTVVKDFLNEA